MRSSRWRLALAGWAAGLAAGAWSGAVEAQQKAQGFDLERLYTSAPGGGWFVMDALDMHGGLSGAVNMIASDAHDPLRVTDGHQHLAVVSEEAFLQVGFAGTYDRFRLYATVDTPFAVQGNSGTVAGYTFTAPSVDPASSPDAISHGRLGLDARLLGDATSAFRLGFGLQLWIPGGAPGALRENYLSDGPPSGSFGAYAAMARVLLAGDIGSFTYAGHAGFYLRTLDDSPTPGSPRGNEGLFGVAGGVKLALCADCNRVLVVGPEVFGATTLGSLFGTDTTALEGLLSGRIEGTADNRPQLRFKIGVGGGLNRRLGAPEERFVLGIELFEHSDKK